MTNPIPQVSEDVKIMAGIGHICLQWARLEMALLGVIYAIEIMPMEKGEIIFGGLDVQPRCHMAINLGQYNKLPPPIMKRLRGVRKVLQSGLADQRNQLVHGAHKNMENGTTTLTMVRWKGEKRDKSFTAIDIHNIGIDIYKLADECWSIRDAIGDWKFGPHRNINIGNPVA